MDDLSNPKARTVTVGVGTCRAGSLKLGEALTFGAGRSSCQNLRPEVICLMEPLRGSAGGVRTCLLIGVLLGQWTVARTPRESLPGLTRP